jgi:beta-lactamase regulating signal transducer with metallopeptidase domain/archaellum component FlaC
METLLDLSRAGDRLLVLLLDAALKGAVVLAAAAGLAVVLRRAPARARHQLWCAALGAVLLLPALAPLVPAWPGLPAPMTRPAAKRPAPERRLATALAPPEDEGASPRLGGPSTASARRAAGPAASQPTRPADLGLLPSPPPPPPARAATPDAGAPGWAGWFLLVWAAGAGLVLAWQLAGLWRMRRLARRAVPLAGGGWSELLDQARSTVGLDREVRLAESPAARSPMTLGWRRPVVLLPAAWRRWSRERRRIVLLHEVVHVRRGDWPLRMALRLAAALHWPNPLTWLALGRLTLEQERACDDEVVALGTRPSTYAAHLLQLARAMAPRSGFPYPALEMARRSQMEGRLMSILDAPRTTRKPFSLPALALVVGLALSLAAVKPWTDAQAAPQVPEPTAAASDLPRTLAEIQRLEGQLEPYEDQLEAIEGELGPLERQLSGIEGEMAPVEERLEGMEKDLEPFEARMEAVAADSSGYEERMEAVEKEMQPFEGRMEELEGQLAPYEARMEGIEKEMEPFEDQLDALGEQMEPVAQQMEGLSRQLQSLAEAGDQQGAAAMEGNLRELATQLAPFQRQMQAIQEQMRPLHERMRQIQEEMQPVHERMRQIQEEMQPVHERMRQAQEEMRPQHEAIEGIQREMEPVRQRMQDVQREMEPFHQRMQEVQRQMEPVHQRMAEVQRQMEPIHEQMRQLHDRLHEGLRREVRGLLGSELGAGASPEALDRAAGRIVESAASIEIEGGRLRLRTSAAEVRQILGEELGAAATPDAVERVVRALGDFEVTAAGRSTPGT